MYETFSNLFYKVPPLAKRRRNIKKNPVLTTDKPPGEENVSMHEILMKMRNYTLK
jgi:hypothetical protein